MIYFVKGDGVDRIKIGHTKWPVKDRVCSMQTGCPVTLRIIHTMEGGAEMEKEIHEILKESRVIGEWFTTNKEVVSFICDRINDVPWQRKEDFEARAKAAKIRDAERRGINLEEIARKKMVQIRSELEAKGFREDIIVSVLKYNAKKLAQAKL